mmetsp:Transcript_6489/g.18720  ORF Transcript_6489/g.18720 Transcript_6489/m.18720 type:complete len:96 (-) Transcript_6489:120-407(-)
MKTRRTFTYTHIQSIHPSIQTIQCIVAIQSTRQAKAVGRSVLTPEMHLFGSGGWVGGLMDVTYVCVNGSWPAGTSQESAALAPTQPPPIPEEISA